MCFFPHLTILVTFFVTDANADVDYIREQIQEQKSKFFIQQEMWEQKMFYEEGVNPSNMRFPDPSFLRLTNRFLPN